MLHTPLDALLLPPGHGEGLWHLDTLSDTARIATLLIPGTCEAFFRTTGRPAESLTLPPPRQPDLDRLLAGMREHGIEFLAPSLAQ
jgi:hypothetical protein